jgi:hypothetical protein
VNGVIFNVVEEVVTDELGAGTWDTLVDTCPVSGSYTSIGTHDDAELLALVGGITETTGLPANDAVVLAGRRGFGRLASRHSNLVDNVSGSRDLLGQLNDVIHPEVLKLYPEAAVPHFAVLSDEGNSVEVLHESEKQLCRLAEGLILGAADHFDEPVAVEHTTCANDGGNDCRLKITFGA